LLKQTKLSVISYIKKDGGLQNLYSAVRIRPSPPAI